MWIEYHFADDQREYMGLIPFKPEFFLTCYQQKEYVNYEELIEFTCHCNEHEFIYTSFNKANRDAVFRAFCTAIQRQGQSIEIPDMGYVRVIVPMLGVMSINFEEEK